MKESGNSFLDKDRQVEYNQTTSSGEEETDVEAILKLMEQRPVPPHVLRKLGLPNDWWKDLSPEFVKKLARTVDERRKLLEELAKY